jgi:hypothetical protein
LNGRRVSPAPSACGEETTPEEEEERGNDEKERRPGGREASEWDGLRGGEGR